nr:YHYH domain-containing protein [Sebaldella sp. S0638]
MLAAISSVSMAHGGRTDKNGCHVDRNTGERHCH